MIIRGLTILHVNPVVSVPVSFLNYRQIESISDYAFEVSNQYIEVEVAIEPVEVYEASSKNPPWIGVADSELRDVNAKQVASSIPHHQQTNTSFHLTLLQPCCSFQGLEYGTQFCNLLRWFPGDRKRMLWQKLTFTSASIQICEPEYFGTFLHWFFSFNGSGVILQLTFLRSWQFKPCLSTGQSQAGPDTLT